MAQRIRSCTNTTNMDTINCDAYLSRLLKQDKARSKTTCVQKCPRDRSASKTRSTSAALVLPTTPPSLKSRPGSLRQHNLPSPNRNGNNSLVHKEVISDNSAMVEVTVRAHTSRRPRTGESKTSGSVSKTNQEPWGNILKTTKNMEQSSSFCHFDPLRTVHFLAKELQTKLKTTSANDPNVMQMITDMQHALNRVPPEIVSTIRLQQELDRVVSKKSHSETKVKNGRVATNEYEHQELPEKLVHVIKPSTSHKGCQTLANSTDIIMESEMFQKLLAASTLKLESSSKQMERLSNQLKNDKEQLELLLLAEKDTVKFLRKQIEEMEIEKTEQTNFAFSQLMEERNNLQAQVTKLQVQLDKLQGPSVQELKSLVQRLQTQKREADEEVLSLRHDLTVCNMEKEKYIAILRVRDSQINEIRTEMSQLQEMVNGQLLDLQKTPFTSSPSSQSTILGNFANIIWPQLQRHRSGESGDGRQDFHSQSEDSSVTNFNSSSKMTKKISPHNNPDSIER